MGKPRVEPTESLEAARAVTRAGYYPLRFFGVEAEGGAMPSALDDGTGVTPFTVRGHAVGCVTGREIRTGKVADRHSLVTTAAILRQSTEISKIPRPAPEAGSARNCRFRQIGYAPVTGDRSPNARQRPKLLSTLCNILVLAGIVVLIASLANVRKIIRQLPVGRSRGSWSAIRWAA